jgi:hypothetical protein
MTEEVEAARQALAKWDAYVAADRAALRTAEQHAVDIRARLAHALFVTLDLRSAIQRCDTLQAQSESPE